MHEMHLFCSYIIFIIFSEASAMSAFRKKSYFAHETVSAMQYKESSNFVLQAEALINSNSLHVQVKIL